VKTMKNSRAAGALIMLAVAFFAFAAGFFAGRMTAGGSYTISTELGPWSGIVSGNGPKRDTNPSDRRDGPGDGDITDAGKGPEGKTPQFPININTSGKEELMLLPSIGEVRAESIIAYREEHGPFRSIADIMQVSGIGEAIYDDIKDYITCGFPGE
jgi:competence ComEA-like helix-hairpin-helix protein